MLPKKLEALNTDLSSDLNCKCIKTVSNQHPLALKLLENINVETRGGITCPATPAGSWQR